MTGPEHYREAERHLSAASYTHGPGGDPVHPVAAAHYLAMAQVHATLALAAATALNDNAADAGGLPLEDFNEWAEAAGVWKPKPKGQTA
jgi:hypothetical protein